MSQRTTDADATVADAVEAFRRGGPVLIHDFDDREGETDIVYPARAVTPRDVARLRNDAGGLVCVAVADEVGAAWELPFLDDAIDHPATADHQLRYDDRSSFSIPVNHRDTFTGITDEDRALTISRLGEAAAAAPEYGVEDFSAEFRSPGHVNLLRGAPNLLEDRQGHTELGLALAAEAGLPPAVVVAEMLDDETSRARSPADASAYARRHGLVYVEGDRLLEALR
ncbi:MAG: 3,4-dihydroxy-2-butanone-4-phosphate synthase [Haloferacaceae archaeon]